MSLLPAAIELAFALPAVGPHERDAATAAHRLRVLAAFRQRRPLGDTPLALYEELACIALLHDVLEGGGATLEQLQASFGRAIAEGIAQLTPPGPGATPERERRYYLELQAASPEIQWVKILDRLDHLASLAATGGSNGAADYLEETERVFVPWAGRLAAELQRTFLSYLADCRREGRGES